MKKMTSKEALDYLPNIMLAKNINVLDEISDCFNIIYNDLEVLDMIKTYYKQILLFYIKKQTSNTYFGQSITEQKKYEEHKQNLFKIKEWLEND